MQQEVCRYAGCGTEDGAAIAELNEYFGIQAE